MTKPKHILECPGCGRRYIANRTFVKIPEKDECWMEWGTYIELIECVCGATYAI
jgi:hypothetical protein